jgi:hypothetical protein
MEPEKKKGKGCLIAAIIVGALMVPCVGGLIYGTYTLSQNEDLQKVGKFFGKTIEIAQKAQNGPGAAELRAAGCQQAMIMSSADFKEMISIVDKDPKKLDEIDFDLVQCQLGFKGGAVDCEQVAQIYIKAAPNPSPRFMAQVTAAGESKPRCAALYDDKGAKISDVDQDNAPSINMGQ